MITVASSSSWFIPALVTGVPGVLVILLAVGNILLGVTWLPNVGRLLGPQVEQPDDGDHQWWANGLPIS